MTKPEDVLDFWFGVPAQDEAQAMAKVRRWFMADPAFDAEINARFGGLVQEAMAEGLREWETEPRALRALILVLDQFTRNTLRGDPRTHACDHRAQALAEGALDRGEDAGLAFEERLFLSTPLLHAEALEPQKRHRANLDRWAPPAHWAAAHAVSVDQSDKYIGIIAEFGRFPHRNALLGRASTPAELAFLQTWGERARPKGV